MQSGYIISFSNNTDCEGGIKDLFQVLYNCRCCIIAGPVLLQVLCNCWPMIKITCCSISINRSKNLF